MAIPTDNPSMAVFCDFENVALGVRDAKYDKFDIKRVLERLLLKGSIVVKKAYCDWERYKAFKGPMHEASFELIEIPHVRQSGKNSADIRLVVDALDLCYTKTHVDTFVIISGDSDFSPLVSKLRENAKQVIGVGVKQSTSDLLIANCDEFIFYDDLVRESPRAHAPARRTPEAAPVAGKPAAEPEGADAPRRRDDSREDAERRRTKAFDLALETFEALMAERGISGRIRASVLKDAIKRRRPDFNEAYFGFRSFGSLLDEAQARGLLEVDRDEKSNTYVRRLGSTTPPAPVAAPVEAPQAAAREPREPLKSQEPRESREPQSSRDRHAARKARMARDAQVHRAAPPAAPAPAPAVDAVPVSPAPEAAVAPPRPPQSVTPAPAAKAPRGAARKKATVSTEVSTEVSTPPAEPAAPAKKAARKRAGTTAAGKKAPRKAAKAPAAE